MRSVRSWQNSILEKELNYRNQVFEVLAPPLLLLEVIAKSPTLRNVAHRAAL